MRKRKKLSKVIQLGLWFGPVGFIALVLWNLERILNGEGADLYRTHWGVNFSSIGFFALLIACVFLFIVAAVLRYKQSKEEKNFIEKYSNKDSKL